MGRKKIVASKPKDAKEKIKDLTFVESSSDFVYCPECTCKHYECKRHDKNVGLNQLVLMLHTRPTLDSEGKCEYYVK